VSWLWCVCDECESVHKIMAGDNFTYICTHVDKKIDI